MKDDLKEIGTKYFGPKTAQHDPPQRRGKYEYKVELDTAEYHWKALWNSIPTPIKWLLPLILALLFQALIGGASLFGPN